MKYDLHPRPDKLERFVVLSLEVGKDLFSIRVSMFGQSFRRNGLGCDVEPRDAHWLTLMDRESELHLLIWKFLNADLGHCLKCATLDLEAEIRKLEFYEDLAAQGGAK